MTLTVAGVGARAVSEQLTRKVSVFGDSDVRSTIGWVEIAGLGCMVETPSEVEHGLFTSKSTRVWRRLLTAEQQQSVTMLHLHT